MEQVSSNPSKMIGTGGSCGASDGVGGEDDGGGVPSPITDPTSGVLGCGPASPVISVSSSVPASD